MRRSSNLARAGLGVLAFGVISLSAGKSAHALFLPDCCDVGKMWNDVKNAAGDVIKNVGDGFKKAGEGLGQMAKGAGQLIEAGGHLVGGFAKGAGKLIHGDLQGAWNEVKIGANKAWNKAKEGFHNLAEGAGKTMVGLAQAFLPFTDAAIRAAKGFLESNIGKAAVKILTDIGKKVLDFFTNGKVTAAVQTVKQIIQAGQQIANAVRNPNELAKKGRGFVIDKLTEVAMSALQGPLEKVVGIAAGLALSALKNIVTIPLAALITAPIASATLGIGSAIGPLAKWAADQLVDWLIGHLQGMIGKAALGLSFVKSFVRDKIVKPIVDAGYNALVGALNRKFPSLHLQAAR
jgi:hypothetical protein